MDIRVARYMPLDPMGVKLLEGLWDEDVLEEIGTLRSFEPAVVVDDVLFITRTSDKDPDTDEVMKSDFPRFREILAKALHRELDEVSVRKCSMENCLPRFVFKLQKATA